MDNKFIEELIYKNAKSILKKLVDSKMLEYHLLLKYKPVLDLNHVHLSSNYENIKDAPDGYFKISLNEDKLEEVKAQLVRDFKAILSRYWKNDLFIPITEINRILDTFKHSGTFAGYTFPRFTSEPNIIWNEVLMRQYRDVSKYCTYTKSTNIKWDFNLVEIFANEIYWDDVIHFEGLIWDIEKLIKFKEYIRFSNEEVGSVKSGSFSLAKNINWDNETIKALELYWDWNELSSNENIAWNASLIEIYKEKVNYARLSANKAVKWDEKLLDTYQEKFDWANLSGNPNLPWSIQLINKYEHKWMWRPEFDWYYDDTCNFYPSISTNTGIVWTCEMIKSHKDKIDLWRVAKRGIISFEVLSEFCSDFNRSEHTGWRFHEYSDFMTITEKLYKTGWENLAENESFRINPQNIEFLKSNFIQLTFADGNLNRPNDGKYVTMQCTLLQIVKNCRFSSPDFVLTVLSSKSYTQTFLNEEFVNDEIWEHLFKPVFQEKPNHVFHNLLNQKVRPEI